MKNDDLDWLSAELGWPLLEETADGLRARPALPYGVGHRELGITDAASAVCGITADAPELSALVAAARAGQRQAVVVGPDAEGRHWRLLAAPIANDGGHIRIALVPLPIESTRAAGHGLVDIAAAVSHEVANAVGSIRGWADLALHKRDATVDVRDALTLIAAAAQSAEQAARSMLMLARGEVTGSGDQAIDLSEFAGEILSLLTLTAREARVTLESALDAELWVQASRAHLFTILFNLVKNAIEACPPGGLVKVQLTSERVNENAYVRLTVGDTGAGLDSVVQARLFERYFTTKAHGTGLGLALVQSAVEASAATIAVSSRPGQGTTFDVTFPRHVPDPEAEQTAPEADGRGQSLDLRVLVVDDDHALREMVATALSLRGATVVSARSSEEALRAEGRFDIALIDMMLNGCRGDELLALLRQRGGVSAAMLVTGTVQKPRLVPGGEPDDWLRKPFEISQLVERIRRTLERHRMLHDAGSTARA